MRPKILFYKILVSLDQATPPNAGISNVHHVTLEKLPQIGRVLPFWLENILHKAQKQREAQSNKGTTFFFRV